MEIKAEKLNIFSFKARYFFSISITSELDLNGLDMSKANFSFNRLYKLLIV